MHQPAPAHTQYLQELADAFTAAHPEYKVKVEYIGFTSGPDKLTAALTSGTAPDVLFDAPGRIIEFGNYPDSFDYLHWSAYRSLYRCIRKCGCIPGEMCIRDRLHVLREVRAGSEVRTGEDHQRA